MNKAKDKCCELYRHFGKTGELLYVGISASSAARLSQHKNASGWFGEISTITIERFATRKDAEHAEALAISAEKPIYNRCAPGRIAVNVRLTEHEYQKAKRIGNGNASEGLRIALAAWPGGRNGMP